MGTHTIMLLLSRGIMLCCVSQLVNMKHHEEANKFELLTLRKNNEYTQKLGIVAKNRKRRLTSRSNNSLGARCESQKLSDFSMTT